MATKRVSVSGLPQLTNADLKNNPSDNTRTSFLVSSRRQVGGINTSYQLDYAQLYTAISSQIADQFNIKPTVGANNKPIYLTGQKFTASTQNIGTDGQFPITLRGGEFKTLPAIGTDTQPVYVNSSGRLTSSAGNVGSNYKPIYMSAGKLQASNATIGYQSANSWVVNDGRTNDAQQTTGMMPIYMEGGVLKAASASIGRTAYNDVQPVLMHGGTIIAAQNHVGNVYRPTYMEYGHIKPCFTGQMGSKTQPVFINANGQFEAANSMVSYPDTSVNGPGVNYQHVASVIFDSNGDKNAAGGGWDGVSNGVVGEEAGDELRVLNTSNNPYGGDPVPFLIPETGWYTFTVEAGTKPCAVVLWNTAWYYDNDLACWSGGWNHTTEIAGVKTLEPNILFYNQTASNMFTYTSFFSEGTIVGVVSNCSSGNSARDDASVYVLKYKRSLDRVPAANRNACYASGYYRDILKSNNSVRQTCATNGYYMKAYVNKRTQTICRYYYPVTKKLKFTKFKFGSENWGSADSIRLYVIRENTQMITQS